MSRGVLAVVGGGPSSTYVLERLLSLVRSEPDDAGLDVHVFERTGEFGAGAVHSARQPQTSFLNRIVGQVSFAADETVVGADGLLEEWERPTLHEWCQREYERTGDARFDLRPEDWPKRFMHGMALSAQFDRYVAHLRAVPGVHVQLHEDDVVDIADLGRRLELRCASGARIPADHVLLVTGHSANRPEDDPRQAVWAATARATGRTFVGSAYPLEATLTRDAVPPGSVVACSGAGLTAIDIALYLSEGRGGAFSREEDGSLRYRPSGDEPARIAMVSGAGTFTFARPFNAKQVDLPRYEHRGRFLTEAAIDALRDSAGIPIRVGTGTVRQLDFRAHLFPLVKLEMAHLHHATLFGPTVAAHLGAVLDPAHARFLSAPGPETAEELGRTMDDAAASVADAVQTAIDGDASAAAGVPWDVDEAVERFLRVVHGAAGSPEDPRFDRDAALAAHRAGAPSPWGHPLRPVESLFSWEETIRPITPDAMTDPDAHTAAVVAFMERDHLAAAQGNLLNPAKAAADGVWRDLRPVLGHAVDFGGLTAESHRYFIEQVMRHHNRLANGAALEVMEKMLALIHAGIVDVGTGPGGRILGDETGFTVVGPRTGARMPADVVVDARVHPFDAEADVSPLYASLLRRGLVRMWENPSHEGTPYRPGGLDLSPDFHPLSDTGEADRRLTFLGPPSEGVMFFQLGALRPQQNHHLMQDILTWIRDIEHALIGAQKK
jgi:hypothetical protein